MRFLFTFVIGLLFINSSFGETFSQILKRLEKESPYIHSLKEFIKKAEGDIITAKAFDNPQLYIAFGRLYSQTDSGIALTDFAISQKLKLWGSRKFAFEEANIQKKLLYLTSLNLKNQYIGEIYQLFHRALTLKKKLQIQEKNLELSRESYRFIEESFKLGEETKINLLRAKRELKKSQLEYQKASLEYETTLKELSGKAGFDIYTVEEENLKPPTESISVESLPQIQILDKQIKKIEKSISLQKALAKPQISVELMGGEDPVDLGKYEFGIGISSTIPVFNQNKGEILKFSAEKNYLKKTYLYLKNFYSLKIYSLKSKLRLLNQQLEKLNKTIIPEVEEGIKLAEESLRLKEITPFEFYNWKRQYTDTLLYKIQLQFEIYQTIGEFIKIGGLK